MAARVKTLLGCCRRCRSSSPPLPLMPRVLTVVLPAPANVSGLPPLCADAASERQAVAIGG